MLPSNVRKAFRFVRRGPNAQPKEIDAEIAFQIQERIDALVDAGWSLDLWGE